ncbi:hypothetical protein KF840_12465 [bacterium]|nr:hypothetical protein [bacterium]
MPRVLPPLLTGCAVMALVAGGAAPHATLAVDGDGTEDVFIPAGLEPLFADMLGTGQTLPGNCTLAHGEIARTAVSATYACPSGEVVVQLVHPDVAPAASLRTDRFAIAVKSGGPPPGLVDALAQRVRERERDFAWMRTDGAGPRPSSRILPTAVAGAMAVMLASAAGRALLRLFGRRRARGDRRPAANDH